MTIQYINTGSAPNSGNGDVLRTAFNKVNANFNEVTTYIVQSATRPITTSTSILWYDTVGGRLYTNVGLTGSWVDTNPAVYYPYATTNTSGVVQIDGTTIVNINTGTIGVNSSALSISTLTNGTYTVALSTAGIVSLPGNAEIGIGIEGNPIGVDFYSPDTNDYISMTYGPAPSLGNASYAFWGKNNTNDGHFFAIQAWNSLTNTIDSWSFNAHDYSIAFPDGTVQFTAFTGTNWSTATIDILTVTEQINFADSSTQVTAFNTASYIDKATLQSIVAASNSFTDFQALIAAL